MTRRKSKQPEKSGPKVPGYIVTFSDMVTLLLTFFVMLLSLATTQDPELFNSGRDSFVEALKGYGLGMLIGKDKSMDFESPKVKHYIKEPEKTRNKRTLDAKEEKLRRIFSKIRKNAKTLPSPLTEEKFNYPLTDVRFAPGSARLNEQAKNSLSSFCKKMLSGSQTPPPKMYVLGLAQQGTNDKQQWTLSALRARAVADFLRQISPPAKQPQIYSWGAGPGRLWTGSEDSAAGGEPTAQIVIGILK